MAHSSIRIASLIYQSARRQFEAVVEFFAPGMPEPLRVPVTLSAPEHLGHRRLVDGLVQEATRRTLR